MTSPLNFMDMQIILRSAAKLLSAQCLVLLLMAGLIFQSCEKNLSGDKGGPGNAGSKKPPKDPPPPPSPFYFNCGYPAVNGSFQAGVPTNAAVTLTYVNSPGGAYAAFTSTVINGITLTAPAGTLNTGAGSIVFNASGTPTSSGFCSIPVSINGSVTCGVLITVMNAPASGPTVDPGTTVGSTGVINFIYRGQAVAYTTVRAADGKIWLQQNLGSPQVAFHAMDRASYGDYFQWGRWDDGHQAPNSPVIAGGPALMNPSNISGGNPNFIAGTTASTNWWGIGGLVSDTWLGTAATATNGKDPCAALGAGWRLPTAAEWQNVAMAEDLFGTLAAFQSTLMLPSTGHRFWNYNGDIGYYWTSNAADNGYAKVFFFDELYNAGITVAERAQGFSCRCVKD